jgi:hypothetical protein
MEIASRAIDQIFENEFIRGTVLLTELQFHSGVKKQKFIIVLNKIPSDPDTLLFITTSQTDFFDRHPAVDHIRLEANALPCFSKGTVIDCREVWSIDRMILKRRYREGTLKFVGVLPMAYLENIDRLVASSRFISLRHKKAILGWT